MLLFLDVDGTLLPFGAAGPYPLYEPAFPQAGAVTGHPLLTRVDPALGARLTSLGCELVWATTWGDDANTDLAPWLGLHRLPLVDWPDSDDDETTGPHWKTRPSSPGRPDGRSSGSTTRSPTPTGPGWRPTIPNGLSCTEWITEWDSPKRTSRCWRSG